MIMLHSGYAFRAFNTHGRALFTLVHRAMATNEDDYVITEGAHCSAAPRVGWNFGDGHMHNEHVASPRCRSGATSNPARCASSCSMRRPIHRQRQEYRLVDAATGSSSALPVHCDRRPGPTPARQRSADPVGRHAAFAA